MTAAARRRVAQTASKSLFTPHADKICFPCLLTALLLPSARPSTSVQRRTAVRKASPAPSTRILKDRDAIRWTADAKVQEANDRLKKRDAKLLKDLLSKESKDQNLSVPATDVELVVNALGGERERSNREVQDILSRHGVSAVTMTYISRLMGTQLPDPYNRIGFLILRLMAQLGEPYAIIAIVHMAVMTKKIKDPRLRAIMANFGAIVRQGTNAHAMMLMGLLRKSEGNLEEAKRLFNLAANTEPKYENAPFSETKVEPITEKELNLRLNQQLLAGASVLMAKELIIRGDTDHAWEVLQVAAEVEHPAALRYLAGYEERYSPKWYQLTMRAAATGHVGAAYDIGTYFSLPDDQFPQQGRFGWTKDQREELAERWFHIGAMRHYGPAMLEVAKLWADREKDRDWKIWQPETHQSTYSRVMNELIGNKEIGETWPECREEAQRLAKRVPYQQWPAWEWGMEMMPRIRFPRDPLDANSPWMARLGRRLGII